MFTNALSGVKEGLARAYGTSTRSPAERVEKHPVMQGRWLDRHFAAAHSPGFPGETNRLSQLLDLWVLPLGHRDPGHVARALTMWNYRVDECPVEGPSIS